MIKMIKTLLFLVNLFLYAKSSYANIDCNALYGGGGSYDDYHCCLLQNGLQNNALTFDSTTCCTDGEAGCSIPNWSAANACKLYLDSDGNPSQCLGNPCADPGLDSEALCLGENVDVTFEKYPGHECEWDGSSCSLKPCTGEWAETSAYACTSGGACCWNSTAPLGSKCSAQVDGSCPVHETPADGCVAHMFSGSTISCTPRSACRTNCDNDASCAYETTAESGGTDGICYTTNPCALEGADCKLCVVAGTIKGWTTAPSEIIASVPVDYEFCIPIPDANNAGPDVRNE